MSVEDDRIAELERENRALRRANAKLARERLGSSNTAAAGRIARGEGPPAGAGPGRPHASARSPLAALRSPLARLRLTLRRLLLRLLR